LESDTGAVAMSRGVALHLLLTSGGLLLVVEEKRSEVAKEVEIDDSMTGSVLALTW